MKTKRLTILIGIFTFLYGCANIEKYQSYYQNSEITRHSVESLKITPSPVDKRPKFDLGADGEAFDFGSGKAFYLAFEVPENSGTSAVYLRCLLSTSAAISSHVALLTANFYDSSFQLLSCVVPEYASQQTMGLDGAYYDATLAIPEDARYLVVFSDPAHFGTTIPYDYRGIIVAGGYVSSSSSTFMIPIGPGGPVRVQFVRGEE